ncbi:MAG TPA: hypothetical protein EYQ66_01840 [Myxococcales bacterium]|nr:hypothetical protein [Myxococcales bacterium]HIL00594.1 hypothetical protein [Myxococcales bacterium]
MHQDFAIKLMIGLGLLTAALFAVVGSADQGIAVIAGAGLGLFNYHWLYQGAVRFFEAAESGGVKGGSWMIMAVLRLGFLAAGLALLTRMGLAPVGLVAGLSVPVISQVVWTTRKAFNRSAQVRG